MAYEGGYQAQQRPYPGPPQPRPIPARGPGPYPPQQARHDEYQGDPGYDYSDGGGYGAEYGDQYRDQEYPRGVPPDQRYPPRSRSEYPPHTQVRGGPPMGSSQYGPGGPLQRAQTMDPMGNGPHPPRGGPPPDPGTGYPTGLPERGGAPGGYGGGLPVNMDLARRPPMNGPMRNPVTDRFPSNGPQPYPGQDAARGGYSEEAHLANKMAGMDISQRSGMPPNRHSGGSQRSEGYDQGYAPNGYDSRAGPAPPAGSGGEFGSPSRSMTMSVNDAMGQRQPMSPPGRMDPMQHGPAPNRGMPAPQHPATSNSNRPPPQRFYPSTSHGAPQGEYNVREYGHAPQQQSRGSYDDIFSAYDASRANPEYSAVPPPVSNEPMPDFDNISSNAARESADLHLTMGNSTTSGPPAPRAPPDGGRGMPRTKSQPDLRAHNAVYEMPADAPPMPALPPGHFGGGARKQAVPMRRPSAPGLPTHPGPARAHAAMPPNQMPPQALDNPDALPSHPTPIRPGLMADSVVNMAKKPPPVRNYTNQSPVPAGRGGPGPPAGAPAAPPPPDPVTPDELEHLRAVYKANTSDQETGLKYAKRLVEAADTLVPDIPDPKARSRARERYLTDAHKTLKKLANGSNKDAMFFYADCLGRGLFGHEPDNKEAFALYHSAAKLGHAQAAYRTAVCCEIGHEDGGGTRKDPLKAIQWYKRSATLGDTPAMYKLGMILLKGLLGQPKNPREAIGWLKRAADQADAENPHALHELGLLYESAGPDDVIIRDEAYAFSLFKKAAELGYKFSQFRLGCAYEYGLMGCPIDPRLSIMWYSKAAIQQEHQAELALSGWYLTGSEGVLAQSDTEAYLWARKAAMAGLAKAEYAMGYFTEVGIGTTANMDDAKRWYWRAAAQDLTKARERLEDLKKSGKSGPRQRERISRSKMQKQQEGECSVM